MRAPLVDPTSAVQPIPQTVNSPDGRHKLLVQAGVLSLGIIRLTGFCHVDDDRAVWRPHGTAGAPSCRGELARFAAIRRQQPNLRLPHTAVALFFGLGFDLARRGAGKGERPAVGRPPGGRVVVAGRVAARLTRLRRRDPDGAVIFVGPAVDLNDDVGNPIAVGRELRVLHQLDGVQVVRLESTCH